MMKKDGLTGFKRAAFGFARGFPGLKRSAFGFTLAELLIALAILGVIATFTIPKILQSQQDGRFNAIAKEAASTLSQAYSQYKLSNAVTAGTTSGLLMPYINNVKTDTASSVDSWPTDAAISVSCATYTCLRLHNGAVLYTWYHSFGGTASTNAISFGLDPDGTVTDGTTNGPGKAVIFQLYTTGRIVSAATRDIGTTDSGNIYNFPGLDPSWFSWK